MTLFAIFESTLINEIGLQFSKNILSLPFLPIKVMIAWKTMNNWQIQIDHVASKESWFVFIRSEFLGSFD